MAGGITPFSCIVARSAFTSELLLIDAFDTNDNSIKYAFEGAWCCDNGFYDVSMIPNEPGLYHLICESHWSTPDSYSYDGEHDFTVRIIDWYAEGDNI